MERDAFLGDEAACDVAERNLQIAIQAAIDIGNHIVADQDLGSPKDYKDIFQLLAGHDVISKALCGKLTSMTGLRNILVHDYLDVDLDLIHRILTAELGDFDEFVAAALKLL